jgi:hypothetical protein
MFCWASLENGLTNSSPTPKSICGNFPSKKINFEESGHKNNEEGCEKISSKKSKKTANPVYNQQRRLSENQKSRDFESSYPRFPSVVGALIIAASILLSTLIFAAGTRFIAVETPNEDVAWLVDRLSGNLYKCRAAEQGKATCEAESATGSIGEKGKR